MSRPVRFPSRLLLAGVLLLGCARALAPPGGEPDRSAPEIIATTPENLTVLAELDEPAVFKFDERISERGARESILVSPATGEVRVDKGRSEIRVRLEGGWKPGLVYRVVLLPGLRDLFNNERRAPASLVFSTGPAIPNTAIAGMISDRVTGRPATQALVRAMNVADSVIYSTVGDSAAFYALTHLPTGHYELRAYVDQNRNRRLDASESASRRRIVALRQDADTVVEVLNLVPADTTPARLTAAQARDSLEVRLSFDDYLDPDAGTEEIEVAILTLPDSTLLPGSPRLLRPDSFDAERRARADSLRAATDTSGAVPARPPLGFAQRIGAGQDTTTLPIRELVLVPELSLTPGGKYVVRISGLTNLTGISDGGGAVEFDVPARLPPQPRDTTGVLPRPAPAGGSRAPRPRSPFP